MKMNRPFDMGANVRRPERDARVTSGVTDDAIATAQARAFSWAVSDPLPAMATCMPKAPNAPIHILGFELLK